MSDFAKDLVGANKVEIVDKDGKVVRKQNLSSNINESNRSEPKKMTILYIKSAILFSVIIIAGAFYYTFSSILNISHAYLIDLLIGFVIIMWLLLWYGINNLKKWAWWISVILLVIGIPAYFIFLSLSTIGTIGFEILNVLVLFYLTRNDIKLNFGLKN